VDWRLELVAIPVSDVDRAKAFYTEKAGFNADHDHEVSDEIRFVQLTPPGSPASIALGKGVVDAEAGSVKGLQLVVDDIEAARAELVERGVDVSEVQHFDWARSSSSATLTATAGPCSRSRRATRPASYGEPRHPGAPTRRALGQPPVPQERRRRSALAHQTRRDRLSPHEIFGEAYSVCARKRTNARAIIQLPPIRIGPAEHEAICALIGDSYKLDAPRP
jgi:catechol 2,3-dioxygenase-like lactoylglutathione lyase family enzyme